MSVAPFASAGRRDSRLNNKHKLIALKPEINLKYKSLRSLLTVVLLATTVCCDKVPINGPLDGQWQLMSIETPEGTRQTKANRTYLCFQLHLTQWFRPGKANIYAHFTHKGDSIHFFDFAHASAQRQEGDNDEWVTPTEMANGLMDDWGVHSTDITFHVGELNRSRLVLECADTVLTFRKF